MGATIKTCDYCGTVGKMPTFMDGETTCYDCLLSFPKTNRDSHREIFKLRADLKLAQAQRDASNREIERLRDELESALDRISVLKDVVDALKERE